MFSTVAAVALIAVPPVGPTSPTHFSNCPDRTGSSVTVIVPSWATVATAGGQLETGDELAVLAPDGSCVGVGVWDGEGFALPVWGDDPFTPVLDGLLDGDPLTFAAYDASEGILLESVAVTYDEAYASAEVGYHGDDFYVLGATGSTATSPSADTEFRLEQTYPNPARGATTVPFALDAAGPVRLEVYDVLGRIVLTPLTGDVMDAGAHTVQIDASALAPGRYVYRLAMGEKVLQRTLTVVR